MTKPTGRCGSVGDPAKLLPKGAALALVTTALLMPAAAALSPIKLAVFDFELEDTSAGASVTGEAKSDEVKLIDLTNEVRQLLANSWRYSLISPDAAAAPARTLHDCGGCEAPVALKLGAEQSFVGVVRRVSRTEYTVRFQIRDARSGAVVSAADSGLRMGADYAWGRGAVRLVKDRLLALPSPQ